MTLKQEGLAMVYAIKSSRHYLPINSFMFYVDHQDFLYLVSNPFSTNKIMWWMLILLEFEFKVVFFLGKKNIEANHMS